jgi:hypothetical protein
MKKTEVDSKMGWFAKTQRRRLGTPKTQKMQYGGVTHQEIRDKLINPNTYRLNEIQSHIDELKSIDIPGKPYVKETRRLIKELSKLQTRKQTVAPVTTVPILTVPAQVVRPQVSTVQATLQDIRTWVISKIRDGTISIPPSKSQKSSKPPEKSGSFQRDTYINVQNDNIKKWIKYKIPNHVSSENSLLCSLFADISEAYRKLPSAVRVKDTTLSAMKAYLNIQLGNNWSLQQFSNHYTIGIVMFIVYKSLTEYVVIKNGKSEPKQETIITCIKPISTARLCILLYCDMTNTDVKYFPVSTSMKLPTIFMDRVLPKTLDSLDIAPATLDKLKTIVGDPIEFVTIQPISEEQKYQDDAKAKEEDYIADYTGPYTQFKLDTPENRVAFETKFPDVDKTLLDRIQHKSYKSDPQYESYLQNIESIKSYKDKELVKRLGELIDRSAFGIETSEANDILKEREDELQKQRAAVAGIPLDEYPSIQAPTFQLNTIIGQLNTRSGTIPEGDIDDPSYVALEAEGRNTLWPNKQRDRTKLVKINENKIKSGLVRPEGWGLDLYSPITSDKIDEDTYFDDTIILDRECNEFKTSQKPLMPEPTGTKGYGLFAKTTMYEFIKKIFFDPKYPLDEMVSFYWRPGRQNSGCDAYETLARLFVFFGGIPEVIPQEGSHGNYIFIEKIEADSDDNSYTPYLTNTDLFNGCECLATRGEGISDISIVRKDIFNTETRTTRVGLSSDTQKHVYKMSVKWYGEEKSQEQYDIAKLNSYKMPGIELNNTGIFVFLKNRSAFTERCMRASRMYQVKLCEQVYGWYEDVKPFLEKIRTKIFEIADKKHTTPMDVFHTLYSIHPS